MYSSRGSTDVAARPPQARCSRLEIALAPAAVRIARHWAADQLGRTIPPPSEDLVDSAVLVISELVTNAIVAVRAAGIGPALPALVPAAPVTAGQGAGGQGAGGQGAGGQVVPLGGRPAASGSLPGRTARVALVISRLDDGVRIEVHDSSREPLPQPRAVGDEAADNPDDEETGRGLTVVSALAADWGWHPVSAGKVVWCELAG